METVKINLKSPVYGTKTLKIRELLECGNELLIKLSNDECYNIYPGDRLIFSRFIYENDRENFVLTEYVNVLSEDENHTIHTTIPVNSKRSLCQGYAKYVSGYTEDNIAYSYHIIKCNEKHNLFPQDVSKQKIYIKDYSDNVLGEYDDISIPLKRSDKAAILDDCLTFVENIDNCNGRIQVFKYDFLPEKISRDSIIISGFDETIVDKMVFLETEYNPFYFYNIKTDGSGNTIFDEYGNEIRVCTLYGDGWGGGASSNSAKKRIVNYGDTRTQIGINAAYWNVNIGLGTTINESSLGAQDTFDTSYVEHLEQSLVPDFIDMERVKYSPMVYNSGTGLSIATGLTFNFHFRKRTEIEDDKRHENTPITSGNVYCDGWYINPNSADTVWWNGMNYSLSAFSANEFNKFIRDNGEISDLLGYLNFTDNDVYYQKKKVSQSFIRLSFYDSWKPIEQKLLYYSTVFLDGSELYGKHIKQLLYIEDNKIVTEEMNQNAVVVFFSGNTSARVDSKIIVTNEYDRTKSSEGFNLYLFADDAVENAEKTIYMKVEFNHAGNGKTTPMIMWPRGYVDKNGTPIEGDTYDDALQNNSGSPVFKKGEYVPLTIDNFIENLYIPIKIKYFNGKYVYYIENAKNTGTNISLILFEPKLDFIEDKDTKKNG